MNVEETKRTNDSELSQATLRSFNIDYLRKRVQDLHDSLQPPDVDWEGNPFSIKKGCRVPKAGRRTDGYAQIKLRRPGLQISPRASEVILFVNGVSKPPNHDISHLCGRGSQGCCEYTHLTVESHRRNLSRKKVIHCGDTIECHQCGCRINIFTCDGHDTNYKCL